MNVNPISNFLLNTKIIMNMGSDKYVINIIDLNSNEIDEIEKNFELFNLIYKLYSLENPNTEPIYNSYPTTIKV